MVSRFALSGSRVDCARLAAVGRGGEAALGLAFVHRVRLLSVGPPARPLVWLVVWVGSVASPCVPALALGALGLLCRVCLASRWAALGFRPWLQFGLITTHGLSASPLLPYMASADERLADHVVSPLDRRCRVTALHRRRRLSLLNGVGATDAPVLESELRTLHRRNRCR